MLQLQASCHDGVGCEGAGESRETGTQPAGTEVCRMRHAEPEDGLTEQGVTCHSRAPGYASEILCAWLCDCMRVWWHPSLGAPWLLRCRRLCYRTRLQQQRALDEAIWQRGQYCWRLAGGLQWCLCLGMLVEDSLHG